MEVVEAVTAAVGAERTGVRISPQNTQVDHVANQLKLSATGPRTRLDGTKEKCLGSWRPADLRVSSVLSRSFKLCV